MKKLIKVNRFIWKYKNRILGTSEATVEWHVAHDVEPGVYRLGYSGNSIAPFSKYVSLYLNDR